MTATLTAVYEWHDDCYIAYVEELPGANVQEATLEEARESLREAVELIIESNRFLAQQGEHSATLVRERLDVAL